MIPTLESPEPVDKPSRTRSRLTHRLTMQAAVARLCNLSLTIRLLGRPVLDRQEGNGYQFRSRKSWALLAYLLLSERHPTRAQLASLLFSEANDPLRALRWSLAEIRRGLGEEASLEGDPVILDLPKDTIVDVEVLARGSWVDAVALPGLGDDLLSGVTVRNGAGFESWLLSEQRYIAAASEAILHEAALATMSRGALRDAITYAARALAMNALDENHQALLIKLYRMAGDTVAAERQLAACTELFASELGVKPGPAITSAMREPLHRTEELADEASIAATVEAGMAAVGAGAVEAGIQTLRSAVSKADAASLDRLRLTSRLALAESLIHSLRGMDEEGSASLHEALEIGRSCGEEGLAAEARAELGYVDFLRARYDRAEVWLSDAATLTDPAPSLPPKITAYLGSVESDRGNYGRALEHLDASIASSQTIGDVRREAYAQSMAGRVHLLRGRLDLAARHLDSSIRLSEDDRWLAFLPWPQGLRGEVELASGSTADATELFKQAFARACQLGDPCWEGASARGLGLVAAADGHIEKAFDVLADARVRCNRLADPYVWLDVYILDAECELGIKHGHPDTEHWVGMMHDLASRSGMKEFVVRSLLHRAAIGGAGDADAARLLGAEIDNPLLAELLVTA